MMEVKVKKKETVIVKTEERDIKWRKRKTKGKRKNKSSLMKEEVNGRTATLLGLEDAGFKSRVF